MITRKSAIKSAQIVGASIKDWSRFFFATAEEEAEEAETDFLSTSAYALRCSA